MEYEVNGETGRVIRFDSFSKVGRLVYRNIESDIEDWTDPLQWHAPGVLNSTKGYL